jgi:hypothetical protein
MAAQLPPARPDRIAGGLGVTLLQDDLTVSNRTAYERGDIRAQNPLPQQSLLTTEPVGTKG